MKRIFDIMPSILRTGLFSILFVLAFGSLANAALPSIQFGDAELVDPATADSVLGAPTTTTHTTGITLTGGGIELNELARGLRYDPSLIYEYVRNKIEIEATYGLTKGARGAHLDEYGTSFDQAHLMVELLRIADANSSSTITANYKFGTISLTQGQFSDWFGISDAKAACQLLARGGFPATVNGSSGASTDCSTLSGLVTSVTMRHVWVEVTVDGTVYEVDPSYKDHTFPAGIDLGTVMGYSSTAISSAASMGSGTESGVSYVNNISSGAVESQLGTYANNLLNYIRNNMADDADMEDVIGGQEIVEEILPNGLADASLVYTTSSVTSWSGDIPDQYRTTVLVEFYENPADTPASALLYVDEVYGRTIELDTTNVDAFFGGGSGTTAVRLQVDDQNVVSFLKSSQTLPLLERYFLEMTVNHPYAAGSGAYMDSFIEKKPDVIGQAIIVFGFGHVSQTIMSRFGEELAPDHEFPPASPGNAEGDGYDKDISGGSAANSTNQKMAANWLAQLSRMAELQTTIGGATFQHHHSLGVVYNQVRLKSSPEPAFDWYVADQVVRLDVSSGMGIIHDSAVQSNELAVTQSIAASASALEGSIFEQMSDAVDTASTAERFEWGSDLNNISSNFRFYLFSPADVGVVDNLIDIDVGGDCPGFCPSDSNTAYPAQPIRNVVRNQIKDYLNDGYQVLAANDGFLGPGWHMGFLEKYTIGGQQVVNRDPSEQRGAAFIAFKEDSSTGAILDVAHIVSGTNTVYKGGGASLDPNFEEEYNPAEAADILKDRFEDRSSALGVDLGSGIPGYSSGTLISTGSGGFPYALSAEVQYKRGVRYSEGSNPNFYGMSHNWESEASISGSGMEALGETNVKNAVASIVSFFVAQDVASQGPTSLDKVVLPPFINHWWLGHMTYNTVSLSVGGNGQQFFRLVDGTWNGPNGSPMTLTKLGGERVAKRQKDDNINSDDTIEDPAALNRHWDYTAISGFILTLGDGSTQTFSAFTWGTPPKSRYLLTRWELPSGFGVTLTYQAFQTLVGVGLNNVRTDVVYEVTNDFGRKLTYTIPDRVTNPNAQYIQIDDLATGRSVKIELEDDTGTTTTGFRITHLDGTQTKVTTGCIDIDTSQVCGGGSATKRPLRGAEPVTEVYSPIDLVNPSLRYTYDGMGKVTLAEDAQSVLDAANGASNPRPGYQFFIVPGHRGERMDPMGGEFTVYYDLDGNPVEFIDELGRSVTASYDGIGRVVERTFPEGDKSQFTYDQNSNVTSFTQAPKPGSPLSPKTASATWNLTYNKPTSVTDFLGNTTTFAIGTTGGAKGQITSATLPKPAALPSAPVWSFGYTSDGQVQSVTDPLGAQSLNSYDALGNLASIAIDATGLNYITNFEYDSVGNRTAMIDARGTAGGSSYKTTAIYDVMNRVISTTGPSGEFTLHEYDAAGREVAVEQQNGNNFVRTRTSYTATGQQLSITSPDGAVSTTFYDFLDRQLEVHDPEGRITRFEYDLSGQLLKEIRAYGTALQQDYSTFTYSNNGQQTSITDAGGNRTSYTYDGFDRLIQANFPDKITKGVSSASDFEAFTYDANGNVVTKTTRRGDVITNGYDVLNRIISKTPGLDPVVEYAYDARGRQTVVKFADNSQSITHTYNAVGQITQTDTKMPAAGISTSEGRLSYTYDKVGNRLSLRHQNQSTRTFNYAYDQSSRMLTVKRGSSLLATYAYDGIGRRTSYVQDSGGGAADRTITYTYEADSALDMLSHGFQSANDAVAYGFDYNLANQVVVRTVDNGAYQYDAVAKVESYTSNGLNQYTDVTIDGILVGLTYDDAGNLLSDGTWTYTYDVENRLLSATDGSTSATYTYDPLGRRVAKTVNGSSTYYLSDGTEEVLELNSSGNVLNRYIFGPGVDEPIVMYAGSSISNGAKRYYRADPQGSIIAITDNDGDVIDTYTYSAYGEPDNPSGNAIRYTGRRWDAETGLYYYRARYYNPSLGRFLQTDSTGYDADNNLYAYANHDPVNFYDATGLAPDEVMDRRGQALGSLIRDVIKNIKNIDLGLGKSKGTFVAGVGGSFVEGAGPDTTTMLALDLRSITINGFDTQLPIIPTRFHIDQSLGAAVGLNKSLDLFVGAFNGDTTGLSGFVNVAAAWMSATSFKSLDGKTDGFTFGIGTSPQPSASAGLSYTGTIFDIDFEKIWRSSTSNDNEGVGPGTLDTPDDICKWSTGSPCDSY